MTKNIIKTPLLTNHFRVNFNNANGHFFHYSVAITYEDGRPVEAKGIGRKILDKVQETYQTDLGSKYFAYDGEKTLFTVGPLPNNKLDFSVLLEDTSSSRNNTGYASTNDRKRLRRPNQSKKFMVEISYAGKILMQAIASALQGRETDNLQDAIRVLYVILRQSVARQLPPCSPVIFFHNDLQNFVHIGGGVIGARRSLKNLRVQVVPSNREYKISGLIEERCKDQMFTLNCKNDKGEVEKVQTTVYKYFTDSVVSYVT